MAQLSLSGSSAALTAVSDCQKNYVTARDESGEPDASLASNRGKPSRRGGGSSGTGFFVSEEGHVVTNHHVIDGCSAFAVARVGSPPVKADYVASDAQNDLAVLRTSLEPPDVVVFSTRTRVGDSFFVYGFPHYGQLATTGNFTVGNITATAGYRDNTTEMQISAPVHPGNSGGALFDSHGNAVGVIRSKLGINFAGNTGDLPQNINFAIKGSVAVNFLESNGIAVRTDAKSGTLDPATVAERAKAATVRVTCRS
jgi:S1-C subfamily serine protease